MGVKEDEPGRLNKVEQQLDEASQQLGVESDEEEMLAAMKEEMQVCSASCPACCKALPMPNSPPLALYFFNEGGEAGHQCEARGDGGDGLKGRGGPPSRPCC